MTGQPKDHLAPGGSRRGDEPDTNETPEAAALTADAAGPATAQPAEPKTPGAGEADAMRGKATRSPTEVATRPHLEGSEQGPS